MSEETQQKLEEARNALSTTEAAAAERELDLLRAVAGRIPERLDAKAKLVAENQPDTTRALGKDGIRELRGQLKALAEDIQGQVLAAAGALKWPHQEYPRYMQRQDNLKTAQGDAVHLVFGLFDGPRADKVASLFKDHGFSVRHSESRRSQTLVSPQDFYTSKDFDAELGALAAARIELARAHEAMATAKAADDKDAVESIWED